MSASERNRSRKDESEHEPQEETAERQESPARPEGRSSRGSSRGRTRGVAGLLGDYTAGREAGGAEEEPAEEPPGLPGDREREEPGHGDTERVVESGTAGSAGPGEQEDPSGSKAKVGETLASDYENPETDQGPAPEKAAASDAAAGDVEERTDDKSGSVNERSARRDPPDSEAAERSSDRHEGYEEGTGLDPDIPQRERVPRSASRIGANTEAPEGGPHRDAEPPEEIAAGEDSESSRPRSPGIGSVGPREAEPRHTGAIPAGDRSPLARLSREEVVKVSYYVPENHTFVLDEMRAQLKRRYRYTPRQASHSNIISLAIERLYEELMGESFPAAENEDRPQS